MVQSIRRCVTSSLIKGETYFSLEEIKDRILERNNSSMNFNFQEKRVPFFSLKDFVFEKLELENLSDIYSNIIFNALYDLSCT